MSEYTWFTTAKAQEAAAAIRAHTQMAPQVGLILGSGLNPLADEVTAAACIPYRDIPYFPLSTVAGHVGRLVIGTLAEQPVMVLQGRTHGYEGLPLQQITFPVRVMHELGVTTLIVTNAAGGINPDFRAGDLMLITDHIGLAAMAGFNPLLGPNPDDLGSRFVNMVGAYDPALRRLTLQVAARLDIPLRKGVYAGLSGPAFETPADVRFLRIAGADAVGMSTVPEVMVARHMSMRVLGISGISNVAIADPEVEAQVDHEEVLAAGQTMVPKLMALLRGVLAEISVI